MIIEQEKIYTSSSLRLQGGKDIWQSPFQKHTKTKSYDGPNSEFHICYQGIV